MVALSCGLDPLAGCKPNVMRRLLPLVLLVSSCGPALAQLDLSGATAPAPVGSLVAPDTQARKARPHVAGPVSVGSPLESGLGGKSLYLNGGKSQIAFATRDKTVDLARLLLAGTKISNSRDGCQVDVSGMPLPLTVLGKANGLLRFSIPIPSCPITFGVLNGAVLVAADAPKCIFKEADCEVAPAGLWGPPPGDIGPDMVKTIERERTQADRTVRDAYKGLVASTKDRVAIRGFASEQAAFSSLREEACRDYIGESRHGFCQARLTQARAAALATNLLGAKSEKIAKKKRAGTR